MVLIHTFAVGFVIALIALADKEAFAWVRGKKQVLDKSLLHNIHVLTWMALLTLTITGAILFYPRWDYLLTQPLFLIKLLFVAVLFVNAILIGRLMEAATHRPFAELRWSEKLQLLASGGISFMAWLGALVLGLILFYF